MSNIEKRVLAWVQKYYIILFAIIITILAIWIRCSACNYESTDYKNYLLPWFHEIKHLGGLSASKHQVGDYNIPYQLLISLITYLHIDPLYAYKIISDVFDFILAIGSGILATLLINTNKKAQLFVGVYGIILMLPTVITNSAYWAQCDAIYSAFVILSLVFLYKQKFIYAFIFLGLALAFKLQAIFIVPFYLYCYFANKNFSIGNFLISIVTFYVICLPGILMRHSWSAPLDVYIKQQSEYPNLSFHFPNVWAIINQPYKYLAPLAIILTISILGYGLFYILSHHVDLTVPTNYLMIMMWTLWSCVMFLPAMHERYGYLLDIVLVICAFRDKRFVIISALDIFISLSAYSIFLFNVNVELFQLMALIYFVLYLIATYLVFNNLQTNFYNETDIKII